MRLIISSKVIVQKYEFSSAVINKSSVLGYGFSSQKSILANRRSVVNLVDGDGRVVSDLTKTADDTILLIGTLSNGIPISFSHRAGSPFKDTVGLDWRIYGENGEIRVTANTPSLSIGDPGLKISVHDIAKGTVEEVKIPVDELDGLEWPARNVGRVYRALADGEVNCTFEDAVQRHELIEVLYKENGYTEA
jgi:predicted dehydrogenase